MALNKLKKWVGTQLWSTFMTEYNDNVDATNAAIDLAEQNAANISKAPILGADIDCRNVDLPLFLAAGTNFPEAGRFYYVEQKFGPGTNKMLRATNYVNGSVYSCVFYHETGWTTWKAL